MNDCEFYVGAEFPLRVCLHAVGSLRRKLTASRWKQELQFAQCGGFLHHSVHNTGLAYISTAIMSDDGPRRTFSSCSALRWPHAHVPRPRQPILAASKMQSTCATTPWTSQLTRPEPGLPQRSSGWPCGTRPTLRRLVRPQTASQRQDRGDREIHLHRGSSQFLLLA